ncbi:MAG: hypothetical protein QOD94_62 [Alphaproteobacteria bacterium]|jgi:Tfp pilus assembly protein PilN|nr:hypothetical protein [Alphaproteobacteria bacterium]
MKAFILALAALAFLASPWHTVEANAAQSYEECYQQTLARAKTQNASKHAGKVCRNKQAKAAEKSQKKK